ncbi:MAG: thiopurine S-methyltransferase [Gammaproteobacteria bacterium]
MEAHFWTQKWADGQIGFHEAEPHPMLLRYFDELGLGAGARVFVPLCGKSNDMPWLAAHGLEVVGVELSAIAVADFFRENALSASVTGAGALRRHVAGAYTLFEGDFYDLDLVALGHVDAIYDRAALIALPPPMRARYAEHLTHLAPPDCRSLLVTVDYDENAVSPPPFIVSEAEIERAYGDGWSVRRLGTGAAEVKGEPGTETAYLLERRGKDAG